MRLVNSFVSGMSVLGFRIACASVGCSCFSSQSVLASSLIHSSVVRPKPNTRISKPLLKKAFTFQPSTQRIPFSSSHFPGTKTLAQIGSQSFFRVVDTHDAAEQVDDARVDQAQFAQLGIH